VRFRELVSTPKVNMFMNWHGTDCGIAEATFYRWRAQYGGLESNEARELKQLREENSKLKRLVADLSLDKAMLIDVNAKGGERAAAQADGTLPVGSLLGQCAQGLSNVKATAQDVPLSVETAAAQCQCSQPAATKAASHSTESGVEHGLCQRSNEQRHQVPCVDDCRRVYKGVFGN